MTNVNVDAVILETSTASNKKLTKKPRVAKFFRTTLMRNANGRGVYNLEFLKENGISHSEVLEKFEIQTKSDMKNLQVSIFQFCEKMNLNHETMKFPKRKRRTSQLRKVTS